MNLLHASRAKKIRIALGFLLSIAFLIFVYWFFFMRGIVSSNDARFDGDLVDLAPQVGGTLDTVFVHEGEKVSKGQTLYVLSKSSLEAAYQRAQAALRTARSTLDVAQAQYEKAQHGPRPAEIKIAEESLKQAQAQLKLANANWERTQGLYKNKVIPEADRDKAQAAWESAKMAFEEAKHHLALLREGTRKEDLASAKANVELAEGRLQEAEAAERLARIQLDDAVVTAPFDGIVVRRWQDPGAFLAPGRPVLTLFNPATLYISANIDEKELDRVAVGDKVDISVDAYPSLDLTGRVSQILRATQSKFSLIPSEGVSGTYIKVSQRVPIRIALTSDPDIPFSPGLSVEIKIHSDGRTSSSASDTSDHD